LRGANAPLGHSPLLFKAGARGERERSSLSINLPSPAKIFSGLPIKTSWRGAGVRYSGKYKPKNQRQTAPEYQLLYKGVDSVV